MNWLKKNGKEFLGSSGGPSQGALTIRALCNRCGEVLQARINLANDLSPEYEESGGGTGYTCRKLLQGSGRCFQTLEVVLTFDSRRTLIDRKVTGGKFVDL